MVRPRGCRTPDLAQIPYHVTPRISTKVHEHILLACSPVLGGALIEAGAARPSARP